MLIFQSRKVCRSVGCLGLIRVELGLRGVGPRCRHWRPRHWIQASSQDFYQVQGLSHAHGSHWKLEHSRRKGTVLYQSREKFIVLGFGVFRELGLCGVIVFLRSHCRLLSGFRFQSLHLLGAQNGVPVSDKLESSQDSYSDQSC